MSTAADKTNRKTPERPDVNAWLNATEEQREMMKDINEQFAKLPRALQVVIRSQIHKAMEAR